MSAVAGALLYQEPGKVPSVVLAVAVHLLLAVFLFYGVRWQSRQPEAVMVELWTAPVAEPAVAQPVPPPKPEVKPEIKPEPKVEKAPEPPKPDIALERKKEPKKEPPKKEVPKQQTPKLNLDRSKDIRAELERETAALERNKILDQMKREGAASAARADAAYIAKLNGKIKSNIVLPPDIPGNPEAIFDVVQLPTGEVISVTLRKSSGHKAYDAAVERAILKSSPLPRPDRPEQYHRNLEIKFRPQELK